MQGQQARLSDGLAARVWQAPGVWQILGVWQTSGDLAGAGRHAGYDYAGGGSDSQPRLWCGTLDGRQACYLAYARPINTLYLMNDNGDTLPAGQSVAASGTIGNSQCTVTWGSSAVSSSGDNLALTLNIAFTAAFDGNRIFYLAARDVNEANDTGWQSMGTWTVQ